MASAKRIKGIKPKAGFGQNGVRIVEARLEEFLSWRAALDDVTLVTELHDMRIAAKRLRYALEIFVLCFPDTKEALKDLTDVQESLGTIHDLDVLADILRERLRTLDMRVQEDAIAVAREVEPGRERGNRLRSVLYTSARNPQRLGLIGLLADKVAERHTCYEDFILRWRGPGLDLLAESIRSAMAPPPPKEEPAT